MYHLHTYNYRIKFGLITTLSLTVAISDPYKIPAVFVGVGMATHWLNTLRFTYMYM